MTHHPSAVGVRMSNGWNTSQPSTPVVSRRPSPARESRTSRRWVSQTRTSFRGPPSMGRTQISCMSPSHFRHGIMVFLSGNFAPGGRTSRVRCRNLSAPSKRSALFLPPWVRHLRLWWCKTSLGAAQHVAFVAQDAHVRPIAIGPHVFVDARPNLRRLGHRKVESLRHDLSPFEALAAKDARISASLMPRTCVSKNCELQLKTLRFAEGFVRCPFGYTTGTPPRRKMDIPIILA